MRRSGGILAVLAALALAACGGGGGGGQPGGQGADEAPPPGNFNTFGGGPPGGTLVMLAEGDADNLNPLIFEATQSYQLVHLMFRAIGRRDSTLSNYTPDFAERWEVKDPTTVVVHVRPGIRWHDGVPTSANDVVYAIQMQKNDQIASTRQQDIEGIASARALDSMTVEVKLSKPGPATVNSLLEVVPVPRHLLDSIPPARMRFAAFNQRPVGNGLFRFVRWNKNQEIVVEANRDAPQRPSLDRIIVRVVPDPSARLTALINGEGDLDKVTADQQARLRASPNVRLASAARVRPGWIVWNVDKPPVNDPVVRRAFLMSVNRQQLAQLEFGPEGEPALSPIPSKLREHSPDVRPIPYNVAQAGQLLQQAGWVDSNGDGIRDKGGQPLRLVIEYSSADPVRQDMLIAMQAMAKQAGIAIVPQSYERTTWVARLRGREFVGSFWGWGWGPGVMGPNARGVWSSASIPPGGANFAGYRNPRLDALLDSVIVEADTGRSRGMWRQIEQTVIDDAVYAPIFFDPEFYGVSSRFRGVKFRGPEWWEDVIYWWIPPNQLTARDKQGAGQPAR
ncbi:ABC transporter substrate-binding protein [Longimicrobium sp.]|uniref:ABC transporter substrate-binding protein n=1 Tax=Longimicrobium sp. TaxID=2029185 RepID=UPI002CC00DD8|nr:ABC transporter substrate-binding protein [Longimicrobium sp.]HSU16872.1 ABC transporter substrate-binding protein [Longimicrobium sp.]